MATELYKETISTLFQDYKAWYEKELKTYPKLQFTFKDYVELYLKFTDTYSSDIDYSDEDQLEDEE